MTEYTYHGDIEAVRFTAEINGNPVIIDVPREIIEDKRQAEHLSQDEMIAFVAHNRNQLVENLSAFLRLAPDVTGINVGLEQLRHCS